MKLYTSGTSPFGARVQIAAKAKGIEFEYPALPVGGLRSAEYLAINPIAKIPVLLMEQGGAIPESAGILRYLEDRFPAPSLFPPDPGRRARLNTAVGVMDTYVMAPVIRLFPHLNPASRDGDVVRQEVDRWKDGMRALAHFMREPLPAVEAGVSIADCALAPSFHLSRRIALMLELEQDPIEPHGVLVEYYASMKRHPLVGPVLEALTAAQEKYDLAAGRPSLASRH